MSWRWSRRESNPGLLAFRAKCSATELQLPPAPTNSRQLHLSFQLFRHLKGLRTVMAWLLRSLIIPKLIGLRTRISGVPTIGLPAVWNCSIISLIKFTTRFLWYLYSFQADGNLEPRNLLSSLFLLSIFFVMDLGIYGAQFFFTHTVFIGAWESRTPLNSELKAKTLSSASSNRSSMNQGTEIRFSLNAERSKFLKERLVMVLKGGSGTDQSMERTIGRWWEMGKLKNGIWGHQMRRGSDQARNIVIRRYKLDGK